MQYARTNANFKNDFLRRKPCCMPQKRVTEQLLGARPHQALKGAPKLGRHSLFFSLGSGFQP
jgi:hypothetical protein